MPKNQSLRTMPTLFFFHSFLSSARSPRLLTSLTPVIELNFESGLIFLSSGTLIFKKFLVVYLEGDGAMDRRCSLAVSPQLEVTAVAATKGLCSTFLAEELWVLQQTLRFQLYASLCQAHSLYVL